MTKEGDNLDTRQKILEVAPASPAGAELERGLAQGVRAGLIGVTDAFGAQGHGARSGWG